VIEPLQTTLHDAVDLLTARGIHYALIGGIAASLRGQTRATADVDLVIATTVEQAINLSATLEGSSFRPLFPDVAEVVERAFILPLRHQSTGVKVDMAIGLSGFEQLVVSRASPLKLAGRQVQVATAEDLLIMKSIAARPQDEADIVGLVKAQADRLDWEYCLRVAAELGNAIGQDIHARLAKLRQCKEEDGSLGDS
jgi:hypothetical protein